MASSSSKSYQSNPNDADEPQKPLPKTLFTLLGGIRAIAGAGLLIAPQFIGKLFHVPVGPQAILFARAVGIRDLVIGELLLTADDGSKDRREVKRALWAGVAVDAVDIGATVFALASGHLGRTGAGMFGSAAGSLLVMGLVGLRGLQH